MANRNFASAGKIYSGHVMPVIIDCNFVVAATAGAGISSLKGPYVNAVYMHSSSPSASNPNPANGTIVVQLADNYSRMYAFDFSIIAPGSGSDVKVDNSALTAGIAYSISILGDYTVPQWHTLGVPAGITPAVGVSFIAASAGTAGNTSTSRVQTSAAAGSSVASIEMLGNPNLLVSPSPSANQGYGASFILQCRDYAGAAVAPAAGSLISLKLLLSNSSVLVNGE